MSELKAIRLERKSDAQRFYEKEIRPTLVENISLESTRFAISQTMANELEEYMNSIGVGCEITKATCTHDHEEEGCEWTGYDSDPIYKCSHGQWKDNCNSKCGGLDFWIEACSCCRSDCKFFECREASKNEE